MDHHTTLHEVDEGSVQAVCSCGWRSPVFGAGEAAGTMGPTAARGRCRRSARMGDIPAISGATRPL